jgi:hypothetical protein
MFLMAFGLIFAIIGGAMLVVGLSIGGGQAFDDLLGLTLTGGIFLLVGTILSAIGVFMWLGQRRDARIRREGIAGTAQIMDIGETNMTVNDRPVLDLTLQVTVPGRSSYSTKKRITMPWSAMGRLVVGGTVPVMVDRVDPDQVVVDWASAPAMGFTIGTPVTFGSPGLPASVAFGAPPPPPPPPVPNQLSGSAMAMPSQPVAPSAMPGQPGAPSMPGQWSSGAQASSQGGEALLQYLRGMGIEITGPMAGMIASAVPQYGAGHDQAMPGGGAPPPPPPPPPMTMGSPSAMAMSGAPAAMAPGPAPLDIRPDESELRQSGIAGRATIRSAEDLGVGGAGERLVRLELEVAPAGHSPYAIQHVTMVPESTMPRLAPGTSLAVHVDRANPQNLAIDWDGA